MVILITIIIGASISESHTCRCVRSSISLYPNFGMFGMFGTGTSPLILPTLTLPFDLANIAFDLTANHCPFDLADIAFDLTANSVDRDVDAKLASHRRYSSV